MEDPRDRDNRALERSTHQVDDNETSRTQTALLALFFALLAWVAGVLAGSVLALLVLEKTPSGPESGWPAIYALVGTTLLIGVSGSIRAFRLYQQKISGQ
ncbi:MAG: hypothetical protein QNI99_06000 [Woeseiaceae bacterium]|nr:hypothetical protein [Woeseiaceae bacterium]